MKDDTSVSSQSYSVRLKKIKTKYQKELGDIFENINRDVAAKFSAVLGEEYLNLISEQKKLSDDYKVLITEAFECATPDYGQDYITAISECADDGSGDEHDRTEKVSLLLDNFLAVIKPDYPVLVDEIFVVQKKMKAVEDRMTEMVKENFSGLSEIKSEILMKYAFALQKKLKEFRVEMDLLKNEFKNSASDEKSDDSNDYEIADDFFIPFKNAKGTLN